MHIATDILIIGDGPTGALLANLLCALECRVAIIQTREGTRSPTQHSIIIDPTLFRNLQRTHLCAPLRDIVTPISRPSGPRRPSKDDLYLPPDPTLETEHGKLEHILRRALGQRDNLTRLECAGVEHQTQTPDALETHLLDAKGTSHITSSWVVRCEPLTAAPQNLSNTALRRGRLILAGEAVHDEPIEGLWDAFNLAFKLARVVRGRGTESLLDTYANERLGAWSRRGEVCGSLARATLHLENALDALLPSWILRARRSAPRNAYLANKTPLAGATLPRVSLHGAKGERSLDALLGYHHALIARPGALRPEDLDWARRQHLPVWTLGVDLVEVGEILAHWMARNRADALLVRPDLEIFGSALTQRLDPLREAWERWVPTAQPLGPPTNTHA